MMLYGTLRPYDIPQLFFRLGSWSLLLHFRPTSRGCSSDDALIVLLRPVAPSTLALLRSALGRFLGRWHFTYQRSSPGAVDGADVVPALWQVILKYPSGSSPNYILASPPAFALVAHSSRLCGRWFLTHWRYPQRSRLVVSPAVALYSALLANRLPRPLPTAGLLFVLPKALLSVSNLK